MLDFNSTKVLSKEEIRELAPSVFNTESSPGVSKHYTHIPTERVIDDMKVLGWSVCDAKEVKARKSSTMGFQKHLVVFRNPELSITGQNGDDVHPQILVTNSHDGKNSFTFNSGLFRMICENGLVISTVDFGSVKIRHMGYDFEELQTQIKMMVEELPLTVESMNRMESTELGQKEALSLAKEAMDIRFGEEKAKELEFNWEEILEPTRPEDIAQSLWHVFNVIQEKIINGNFTYRSNNKIRKAREVKNFTQDQTINSQLFEKAMEYVS